MIYNEFLPDAVQWSEGMLLSPQHFQQNDIFIQALVQQRLLGLTPNAWGLRHLKLDAPRIADGVIKILECDAVMPDGLPLAYRAAAIDPSLTLDVSTKLVEEGVPVRVVLAIPPRAGALKTPSTSVRRYDALPGDETLDEVTGIGDVVVERQRARFELFVEADAPNGYAKLPLMDVVRDSNGVVTLGGYHPPMFRLGASAFLGAKGIAQQLDLVRDGLWSKFRELVGGGGNDEEPASVAMLSAEARMHLQIARDIAACLPLFDAILADPLSSPSQAWSALAHCVGRMAGIGSNPRPLAMDPYRHIDCAPQFQAALAFLNRKLALVNTQWDSLAFARVSDGIFARRLPEETSQTVYVELRAGEGQTANALHAWLGQARIASEDLLPMLRQRRLLGAQSRPLTTHEVSELGLRPGALVCELTNQRLKMADGLVDSFRAGRSLVVQGEASQAPAAIILHHRKGGMTSSSMMRPSADGYHA